MTWTAQPPTKPGYYWWRTRYELVKGQPRVVHVYETMRGLRMAFIGADHVEILGQTAGEFWSEEIVAPKEETERV